MNPQFQELLTKNPQESSLKLVYKYLYHQIISLAILPGAKINITKIAKELEVSRTTVRDAVSLLVDTTLVEPQPNQGFSVKKLNIKEMSELYATRRIIETGAAKILCEKITPDQIHTLHTQVSAMEQALLENDYELFAVLDCTFHQSIVTFCDNQFVISAYASIFDFIFRYIAYTAYLNYDYDRATIPSTSIMLRHHKMIALALENGMSDNVATVIDRHFTEAEKSLLQQNYYLNVNE